MRDGHEGTIGIHELQFRTIAKTCPDLPMVWNMPNRREPFKCVESKIVNDAPSDMSRSKEHRCARAIATAEGGMMM